MGHYFLDNDERIRNRRGQTVFYSFQQGFKFSILTEKIALNFQPNLSPYVVLLIFLIMGLTQEGGVEGLKILLTPDWSLLASSQIWVDASSQIFYSFGVCFGVIIAFSSYNPLDQNLVRDGLVVTAFNCGTSIFGNPQIIKFLKFILIRIFATTLKITKTV